jgi:uncharacterized membrane protein
MNHEQSITKKKAYSLLYLIKWKNFIVIVLIVLGILFRCINLGDKIFWVDEVATAVRISGYTQQEIIQEVSDRGIVSPEDLLKYQRLNPSRNLGDSIAALRKSPEHAPLYFLLARFWSQLFGSSVVAIRSLSIVFSLIAFPCIYYLSRELFSSFLSGEISLILLSISPFFVAYSQEARPYSLWTVTILLSSITLLRAIRINFWLNWVYYTISLIFAFYTSLLSLLVALGYTIYLILITKLQTISIIKNYFISLIIAIIAFIPWLVIINQNWQALQENTSWMQVPLDIGTMAAVWIASILLIFGDLPLSENLNPIKVVAIILILLFLFLAAYCIAVLGRKNFKKQNRQYTFYLWISLLVFLIIFSTFVNQNIFLRVIFEPLALIGITTAFGLLFLVVYSFLFLLFNSNNKIGLFLLSLTFTTPFLLISTDLLFGGQRSPTPRYLIPAQLGILLTVIYLLSNRVSTSVFNTPWQRQAGKTTLILLTIFGIISCGLNLNESSQFQKSRNLHNPDIAAIINQAKNPIVLTEADQIMDVLSISHNLDNKVKMQILKESLRSNCSISALNDFSCLHIFISLDESNEDIFLFNPSANFKKQISQNKNLTIKQVYKPKLIVPGEIYLSLWSLDLS